MMTAEQQYLALLQKVYDQGFDVKNERTGKVCRTIINADLEYDVGGGEFPILNTRKSFWKMAVAELLGYIGGHTNAADFRRLGTTTWDANANKTQAWLDNPFRKGEDDMGRVYGANARSKVDYKVFGYTNAEQASFLSKAGFSFHDNVFYNGQAGQGELWVRTVDQLKKVYDNLRAGKDDRFEMISFHDATELEFGCLRSCMYSHQFSILDGTLYLHSTQRSCDVPLGLNFNMVQVYVLLAVMAQITGLKPGRAFHKIVNAHIYEDQLPLVPTQLARTPLDIKPEFIIDDSITDLDGLCEATLDNFEVRGYKDQGRINYPFSV